MRDAGVAATRVTKRRLLTSDAGIRGAISVLNCDGRLQAGYFVRERDESTSSYFVVQPKFFHLLAPPQTASGKNQILDSVYVYLSGDMYSVYIFYMKEGSIGVMMKIMLYITAVNYLPASLSFASDFSSLTCRQAGPHLSSGKTKSRVGNKISETTVNALC